MRPFLVLLTLFSLILGLLYGRDQSSLPVAVVGDVRERLAARVPEAVRDRYFDAAAVQVGVGAVAIGGWESLGDGLVVGGQAWLRTTHPDSPYYYAPVANRYFQSNALIYVPAGTPPLGVVTVGPDEPWSALLARLTERYPDGVLIEGHVAFRELRTIAITEAAIHGVPVLNHAARYYTRPMERFRDRWAYVAAAIAPRPHALWRLYDPLRQRALSRRPKQAIHGLAHALVLDESPAEPLSASIHGTALALGQIQNGSVLSEGVLRVYPLHRFRDGTARITVSASEETTGRAP